VSSILKPPPSVKESPSIRMRNVPDGFGLAYSRSRKPSEFVLNGVPETVVERSGLARWCSTGSLVM